MDLITLGLNMLTQGQDDGVALGKVAVHPLDGVGVDVRGDHFHCGSTLV